MPKKLPTSKFAAELKKAVKASEKLMDSDSDETVLEAQNRLNSHVLDQAISEIGWPTISKVGSDAARCAYLIALHTNFEPAKQIAYLVLMNKNKEDIDLTWLAYLTDRVCVGQGRPQEFGTQFEDLGDKLALRKVKNWDEMVRNRIRVELDPIEEHAQLLADSYDIQVVLTKTKVFNPTNSK